MHTRFAIFTLALLPALAYGQQKNAPEIDPRQAQLQAATVNGTASLRDQVLHTRVSRDMLVSDYLQRTGSTDSLNRILQSAQTVGGPRWIDEHTCQVRMEIPASQVESFLIEIARDHNRHSPLSFDAMKSKLSSWNRQTFTGVGSSVGGDAIESARLHDSVGKWSEVTDSARRSAVAQARVDATRHVINQLGTLQIQGASLTGAMSQPLIESQINAWLLRQPITRIEFLDDLKVSVTLSVAPTLLADALKSAVESDAGLKPVPAIDWSRLSAEIEQLPPTMTGTASAITLATPATAPALILPTQAPDWVDQHLEADASATGGRSRLKTSRMAETSAVKKIRDQFLSLDIAVHSTIGDAAKADPKLLEAVDRAMLHTHTHQVEYRADGSVKVSVDLDLQDAWDELRSNP